MKQLFLLELNELNFDVVKKYLDSGEELPGFRALLARLKAVATSSESQYEELEPWIQWPSVHTGKSYFDHGIFRLGDITTYTGEQIFEHLERKGVSVGAVSAMNAANRLRSPSYFIPDPWTDTPPDGSLLSRLLSNALKQAVNDNAQAKLTGKTLVSLIFCFIALVHPTRYLRLFLKAIWALKKPWRRAIFLDEFLWNIHRTLFDRKKPNFSVLFLNAGAHIQHHYFLNSSMVETGSEGNPDWYCPRDTDPLLELLQCYSDMLLDLPSDSEIVVATGLTQKPHITPIFYYRLKNHEAFLRDLGVPFLNVHPRMTRDFLVVCETERDADFAKNILAACIMDDGQRCFGEIEVRGKELFVVLTYPNEIKPDSKLVTPIGELLPEGLMTFVAIKNGEHTGDGFAFFSRGLHEYMPDDGDHVSYLYQSFTSFFTKSISN